MESSTEEEEEQFFETLEDIESTSDADSGADERCMISSSEGNWSASRASFSRYDVWKNSPGSILERRQRLFMQMGLKVEQEDSEISVVVVGATPALSSIAPSLCNGDSERKECERTTGSRGDEVKLGSPSSCASTSGTERAITRSRSDGTFSKMQSIEVGEARSTRLVRSGTTSPDSRDELQKRQAVSTGSVNRTGSGLVHLPSKPPLGGKHVNTRKSSSSIDGSGAQKIVSQRNMFGRFRLTDRNANSLFHSDLKNDRETRFPSLPLSNGGERELSRHKDEAVMCRIKDLDSGKEFVVNEVGKDGMWNKLKDLDTGREITMEEFESSLGLSPLVQEVMRRERAADDSSTLGTASKVVTGAQRGKNGWLRAFKGAVKGSHERGSSSQHGSGSDKEASTERSSKKSGSATDDSQDAPVVARPVKVRVHKKSMKEFGDLRLRQEIQAHQGAIWTMKFSLDGSYLATAGQDKVVKVWEVFVHSSSSNGSPTSSGEMHSVPHGLHGNQRHCNLKRSKKVLQGHKDATSPIPALFLLSDTSKCSFEGHKEEVLDLSWSPCQSLLSSSMDKTVRLWNIASKTCLKIFAHNDYVTCIQFHPFDSGHFLSGSLDGKVRIWCVQEPQVVDWVDLQEMVTAACYTPNGQGAVVGSYKGICRFYETPGNKLQLDTTFDVRNHKSKTKRSQGKKITGFQFVPGDKMKVLITSSDSRIRVFDGTEISSKFKGFRNSKSHISASFSKDGRFIISASEDSRVCIWNYKNSGHDYSGIQRTISGGYEDFAAKNVLVAIPWPGLNHSKVAVSVASCPSELSEFQKTSNTACKEQSLPARSWSDNVLSATTSESSTDMMNGCTLGTSFSNLGDAELSGATSNCTPPRLDSGRKSLISDSYQDNYRGSSLLSNGVPVQHVGNNGFFPDSKGSATWPEEKLPTLKRENPALRGLFSPSNKNPSGGDHTDLTLVSAHGLVIVTGGMGGEIRVFQNYSLPVRL